MMKKFSFKKIISIFLAISFCMSMLSVGFVSHAANVARVDGNYYSSLEEAISAAKNGSEVVLLADTSVNSPIIISKSISISSEGSHTISRGASNDSYLFSVSGALNIRSGITVDGKGYSAKAALFDVSGLMTINSGVSICNNTNTSTGGSAVTISGGEVNFRGGTVSSNSCSGYGNSFYLTNSESTLRMGDDASFGSGCSVYMPTDCYIEVESQLTGSGNLVIYMPRVAVGNCVVSGVGDMGVEQTSRFSLFCGTTQYKIVESSGNLIAGVPTENPDCAKVNGMVFKSVNEAFDYIEDGTEATVTIIADCAINETVNVYGSKRVTLTSDSDVALFRGFQTGAVFNINSGSSLTVTSTASLTVSGSNAQSDSATFNVQGELNIGNGAALTSALNTGNGGAIALNGGTVNMTGGVIKNNTSAAGGAVYLGSGTLNLSGGVIHTNTAALGGSIYFGGGSLNLGGNCSIYTTTSNPNDIYLGPDKEIYVNNWTPVDSAGFTNSITLTPANVGAYVSVAVFEGTAKKDHFILSSTISSSEYALLAQENRLVIAPASDAYIVYSNGNGYSTIEDAIAAAGSDECIIEVVGDISISNVIMVPAGKNITLYSSIGADGSDYSMRRISRASGYLGALFYIEAGGTLSIGAPSGKALVIDGDSASATEAAIMTNGTLNLSEGTQIVNCINNANEATELGVSYGGAVLVNEHATLNIYGATFENCYASFGGAIFNLDGTVYISSGSITNCSALNGGAVYLLTTPIDGSYFASMYVLGCNFTGNNAIAKDGISGSGVGGAIYVENGSVVTMVGGNISGNQATKGAGVAIGNTILNGQTFDEAKFAIADNFVIAKTDTIYVGSTNLGCVTVAGDLIAQPESITLSIPDELPQNMKLVKYLLSDNSKDNENAATSAIAAGRFVLEDSCANLFVLEPSTGDGSVIVNANPGNNFGGYKSGKHYNGISQYVEDEEEKTTDTTAAKDTTAVTDTTNGTTVTPDAIQAIENELLKEEAVYNSISVPATGSFSAYFEMSYYANLYSDMNRCITAPFIKGTTITLIDSSDSKNVGYYYYTVTGSETAVKNSELIAGTSFITPSYLEIPLSDFYKMGSKTQKYTPMSTDSIKADGNGNVTVTDKMTFVVDFAQIDTQNIYLNQGSFTMTFNHYFSGVVAGERYDISENFKKVEYNAVATPVNKLNVNSSDGICDISYMLDAGSNSVSSNNGVIVITMAEGIFQGGSYFEDENGNQYPAQNKSNTVYIPMPKDAQGNILSSAGRKYTLKNYFRRDINPINISVSILASLDGTHKTSVERLDCTSSTVALNSITEVETALIVKTPGKEERPYFPSIKKLDGEESISLSIQATIAGEASPSVTMTLLKKNDNGVFEECDIGELFQSGDKDLGRKAEIATGDIALRLKEDIISHADSEYRLKLSIGSNVEYIKINDDK